MYLESWHIKKELIKAIESTNCEEGELLIIKTKLKEFTINCLNFIFGFGVLGVFFGLGGLILGGRCTGERFWRTSIASNFTGFCYFLSC